MGGWILGFDIGGTKLATVAGRSDGQVLTEVTRPSHAHEGFGPMWERIVAMGQELVAGRGAPDAIGVSIGGPVDSARGLVLSPPNLPGWDSIPLGEKLRAEFGVPAFIEHDAKAGALAEWMFGAGRGRRTVIFLTFGTGLGAGLVLDGRLHRGALDGAGEVGHWHMADHGPVAYGKEGSWEAFCSGAGLPRLAHHLFPDAWPETLTAAELIDLARGRDEGARRVIETSALWLGRGIAQLVDLLNPDVVVLGSLAVRAGDLFLPVVRDVVRRECLPGHAAACDVVATALGEKIGSTAALCAAIYQGGLNRSS
jgi:glucokinase